MIACVPYGRAVRAEFARSRASSSSRFAVAGLGVAVLQGAGWWVVATQPLHDWGQLLGWQALYATGLCVPLTALLVALTVARERRAREGGTLWRPLSARVALSARATVLAAELVAFNAALTLPILLFGWSRGLADAPVGRLVGTWLALWLSSLLPAALALVLARIAGLYVTVGVAIVWQVAGTIASESASWGWQPWTWQVRAVLPLLGIHSNGVGLEPGSPIWSWSPVAPTTLSVLMAAAVVITSVLVPSVRLTRHRRITTQTPTEASRARPIIGGVVTRGRARPMAGLALSLRRTALPPLIAGTVVVLPLVAVIWDAAYLRGFSTWLVVPLGTCVMACLLWASQGGSWRVLALRAPVGRLAAGLLTLCLGVLTGVVAVATGLVGVGGDAEAGRFGVVLWATGAAWLTVCLWLATRFGAGAAIGATLVVLVVSVVFDSTYLASTPLWLVGILGWPEAVSGWARAGTAVGLSTLLGVAAGWAWFRALHRAT